MAPEICCQNAFQKRLYLFTMSSVIYQKICFTAYSHQNYGQNHLESILKWSWNISSSYPEAIKWPYTGKVNYLIHGFHFERSLEKWFKKQGVWSKTAWAQIPSELIINAWCGENRFTLQRLSSPISKIP